MSDLEIVDPFAEALDAEPDPVGSLVEDDLVESTEVTREQLMEMAQKMGLSLVTAEESAPVAPPTPESELSPEEKAQQHSEALRLGGKEAKISFDSTQADEQSETILFHFTDDGFTALNKMWYRGEELEFIITRDADGTPTGSPAYLATLDREGESWVHIYDNPQEQFKRYGKILYAPGPWPGSPLPETIQCGCVGDKSMGEGSVCRECNNTRVIHTDKAAEAERKRARRPPVPVDDAIMRGTSSRR